jgi:hypothetical protein
MLQPEDVQMMLNLVKDKKSALLALKASDESTLDVYKDVISKWWEFTAALIMTRTPKPEEYTAMEEEMKPLVRAFGRSGIYIWTHVKHEYLIKIEEAGMLYSAPTPPKGKTA